MDTLIHADIFFFISSIAAIIWTALGAVALWYLIKGLKNFREISEKLNEDMDDAKESVRDLIERMNSSFVFNMLFPPKKKKTVRGKLSEK